MPRYVVGLDLTDPFTRCSRPIDVAIIDVDDGERTVHFQQIHWPRVEDHTQLPQLAASFIAQLQGLGVDKGLLVVDGPQALARPREGTRQVERFLRTPAHTPWQEPEPGARPFAGYIRGSIQLFRQMVETEFELVDLPHGGRTGKARFGVAEAYPGAAWLALTDLVLHRKGTREGRQSRHDILSAAGLRLPDRLLPSHDQNDAALCALLGLRWEWNDGSVQLVGDIPVYRDEEGILREGRMLLPSQPMVIREAAPAERHPAEQVRQRPEPQPSPSAAPRTPEEIPRCDWVYFATAAGADLMQTLELAVEEGVIHRTLFANVENPNHNQAIANVQNLQPSDTLLLAYQTDGGYHALGQFRLTGPDDRGHGGEIVLANGQLRNFPACMVVDDEQLHNALSAAVYDPDPRLGRRTVICVELIVDHQQADFVVPRPAGNNTLWRWNQVFGA